MTVMGASQERKKRRLANEAEVVVTKEEPKKKKGISITAVAIIAVVIFALIVGVATYFTSDYFYQNTIAVRIGDTEYTIADYNYYYWRGYQSYYDSIMTDYPDTYMYYLPNENIPYDEQYFGDDVSWAEFFDNRAMDMLQELTFLYNGSVEEGYKLSLEGKDNITSDIVNAEYYALNNGYGNIDAYLAVAFGKGMDLETYRMNLERYELAYEYAENKALDFGEEFEPSDLDAYYARLADTYDILEYRSYEFVFESEEGADENKARDDAYYAAEAFKKAVKSEQDFIDMALENAPEDKKTVYENPSATFTSAMAGNISDHDEVVDWALEEGRKAGDMEIVETETSYVVVYFVNRNDNSYNLVNARHILIQAETVLESDYEDDDAGYEAALAEANEAAKAEAEDILEQWKSGVATEDSFAALADELSDDTAEGGLYEDIYQGMMVAGFNEWIFEDGRKAGDVEVVESEYGYHIIYFVGEGPTYANFIAQNDLGAEMYNSWYEENYKEETIVKTWAFKFAA